MKSGSPKPAPKVSIPSRKHPNVMKEKDTIKEKTSKMWPLKSKRLSK